MRYRHGGLGAGTERWLAFPVLLWKREVTAGKSPRPAVQPGRPEHTRSRSHLHRPPEPWRPASGQCLCARKARALDSTRPNTAAGKTPLREALTQATELGTPSWEWRTSTSNSAKPRTLLSLCHDTSAGTPPSERSAQLPQARRRRVSPHQCQSRPTHRSDTRATRFCGPRHTGRSATQRRVLGKSRASHRGVV